MGKQQRAPVHRSPGVASMKGKLYLAQGYTEQYKHGFVLHVFIFLPATIGRTLFALCSRYQNSLGPPASSSEGKGQMIGR